MDRLIEVKVNGHHLTKDSNVAGVQHEANAKVLRITFDEGWEGYAKRVTFWDGKGQNPVVVILTIERMEDQLGLVYLCPIPGEAMAEPGWCRFVIDGYQDGVRQRSLGDHLRVEEAPYAANAGEAADPTPTQAEQLQAELEHVLEEIVRAIQVADTADRAKEIADNALAAAERAEEALRTGTHASRHAVGGDDPLTPASIGAATPGDVQAAMGAANAAASAASAAHGAANNAQNTANGKVSRGGDTMTGRLQVPQLTISDYGSPLEGPQYIDFHTAGSNLDYNARLSINGNHELLFSKWGDGDRRVIHEGLITKSTADIAEGTPMAAGSFYIVYE